MGDLIFIYLNSINVETIFHYSFLRSGISRSTRFTWASRTKRSTGKSNFLSLHKSWLHFCLKEQVATQRRVTKVIL